MFTAITIDTQTTQRIGEYVTFERFLINIGNTFDLKTGTFTSPVDGLFEFGFSGSAWYGSLYIQVWHNEAKKLSISTGMFILKKKFH